MTIGGILDAVQDHPDEPDGIPVQLRILCEETDISLLTFVGYEFEDGVLYLCLDHIED